MSHLVLATGNSTHAGPSAQWAHDIRNALSTVGLHLETLERLSGTRGREIAHAAHVLMSRAAAMCNEAMAQSAQNQASNRRSGFDIVKTIGQVANLLRPAAPEGFEIRVAGNGVFAVQADPQEVFRILFNLVRNALNVARDPENRGQMTCVTILVERSGSSVAVRIADDGPGLPSHVRANLFRSQPNASGTGLGLAIARKLAERNGGVLELVESARGTTFVLELTALNTTLPGETGALRSLGRRVVQH
jgi:signal transduction histidine kinase